ncbi:hypothetical protein HZ326_6629 [Fusarium oxysporum f. sp. albedinis]|nr:hypothetical protein HZ326_6629 [Fusarium oxysporum f. sp. albedinis]
MDFSKKQAHLMSVIIKLLYCRDKQKENSGRRMSLNGRILSRLRNITDRRSHTPPSNFSQDMFDVKTRRDSGRL